MTLKDLKYISSFFFKDEIENVTTIVPTRKKFITLKSYQLEFLLVFLPLM